MRTGMSKLAVGICKIRSFAWIPTKDISIIPLVSPFVKNHFEVLNEETYWLLLFEK